MLLRPFRFFIRCSWKSSEFRSLNCIIRPHTLNTANSGRLVAIPLNPTTCPHLHIKAACFNVFDLLKFLCCLFIYNSITLHCQSLETTLKTHISRRINGTFYNQKPCQDRHLEYTKIHFRTKLESNQSGDERNLYALLSRTNNLKFLKVKGKLKFVTIVNSKLGLQSTDSAHSRRFPLKLSSRCRRFCDRDK